MVVVAVARKVLRVKLDILITVSLNVAEKKNTHEKVCYHGWCGLVKITNQAIYDITMILVGRSAHLAYPVTARLRESFGNSRNLRHQKCTYQDTKRQHRAN